MPTIQTGINRIYRAPKATVFVGPDLIEDSFEEVEYLRLDRLRMTAAPEIDTCQLHYQYGYQRREGEIERDEYEKLDIVGQFVKVEIVDTVIVAGEPELDPIVWYGIIEAVEQYASGEVNGGPSGVQVFRAFGLLRLLEKTYVKKSFIKPSGGGTDLIEIETALPFNLDQSGEFAYDGNRDVFIDGMDTFDAFSPRQKSAQKWSVAAAVKYLLKRFAPKGNLGSDTNPWAVDPAVDIEDLASWYEFSVDCDLKNVKTILDELLSRNRGLSYYVYCEPDANPALPNKVYLKPFTFAASDVSLPGSATLPANPDQYTLDFENAYDVIDPVVADVATARFHYVRVVGEFITSTFTTSPFVSPNGLDKDWTSAEETAYLAGASAAADYAGLDEAVKKRRNAYARAVDKHRHVFSRFKLNESWDRTTLPWHDDQALTHLVAPEFPEEDGEIDPVGDEETAVWLPGLQIERHLPFHNRWDYSGQKIADETTESAVDDEDADLGYIPPLAYIRTNGEDDGVRESNGDLVEEPPRYAQVEVLNHNAFDDEEGRHFACHLHVRRNFPAIEVRAHPNQMLAVADWGGAAVTDDTQDPTKAHGLDWRNLFVTMCVRIPKRVQCMKQIAAIGSEPVAELLIYVPEARLDYVVPYTTVRIDDGIPIVTTSGGCVRDDRIRVARIARAAAEWYGNNRKTLSMGFKQVRGLFELGWLITDVGANYSPTGVNTPITAIEYQFTDTNAPTTSIETSFAALDFNMGRQ